jgi:nicotinamidase-related amidase
MAGEPILLARNCAVVLVDEPLAQCRASNRAGRQWPIALKIAEAVAAPFLDLRGSGDFVVDTALMGKLMQLQRRAILLMGALLEGAVTQIALSTLLEGYDVYVCVDQVATADLAREALFLERIRSCAGHIVTSRQVLLELLSREKDKSIRKTLLALLDTGV